MSARLFKLIIALSLLANVLLISVAFGHIGRNLVACHTLPHHRIDVHQLIGVLSPQKQEQLAQAMAQFDHNDKQFSDLMAQERKKLVAIVKAKPFNKDAYMAQIKAIDDARVQVTKNISDMVSQIAAQCDDEERLELAARMETMLLDKQN
jgi:uncharacterized membrane protein